MNKLRIVVCAVCAVIFGAQGFCQEPPGTFLCETTHFSVYTDRGVDPFAVLAKLDAGYLVASSAYPADDYGVQEHIGAALDSLYSRVSDILDIHVYSLRGKILFVADRKALAELSQSMFKTETEGGFLYWYPHNTIYVSLADLQPGPLGRQMAYSIISHYFIVPPPVTIQDVLSGYVERQLSRQKGS